MSFSYTQYQEDLARILVAGKIPFTSEKDKIIVGTTVFLFDFYLKSVENKDKEKK